MNIYDFLRSRDVAAYCREINKTWNTFEMAAIIGRADCTISEKHKAWRELIDAYPDMPAMRNIHGVNFDSLHRKLGEIIDYEERALALFKTPEPNAVYAYTVRGHKDFWRHNQCRHSESVFSCCEDALTDAKDSWERDEVSEITVAKMFVRGAAGGEGRIEVIFDYNCNPYRISVCGDRVLHSNMFPDIDFDETYESIFDMFYTDIPTPFKRGDLLTICNNPARPREMPIFVLNSLDRDDPKILARFLSGDYGDGSDMVGWGFFVDDGGYLYGDHTQDHDSFAYYRGRLEGKERLLHYAGLFLKGEISLSEILTMQCRLIAEHRLNNDFRIDTHSCCIPEHLLAENRLDPEEKELYLSVAAKIARMAYGLVCNHPFVDGNKRIGVYVMMVLLELNRIETDFTDGDVIRIGLELASGKMNDKELLSFIMERAKQLAENIERRQI
jgi:death-on-curing protein